MLLFKLQSVSVETMTLNGTSLYLTGIEQRFRIIQTKENHITQLCIGIKYFWVSFTPPVAFL